MLVINKGSNMKELILIFFGLYILSSCANLEASKGMFEQEYNVRKMVGIGDLVYSSSKRKSLPNVFGKADIFGRTTIAGKTTVIYTGIKDNKAVFERRTIDVDSGETTMNDGVAVLLNSMNNNSGVMVQKRDAVLHDRGVQSIAVDVQNLPQTFSVEGNKITVHQADTFNAEVSLSK